MQDRKTESSATKGLASNATAVSLLETLEIQANPKFILYHTRSSYSVPAKLTIYNQKDQTSYVFNPDNTEGMPNFIADDKLMLSASITHEQRNTINIYDLTTQKTISAELPETTFYRFYPEDYRERPLNSKDASALWFKFKINASDMITAVGYVSEPNYTEKGLLKLTPSSDHQSYKVKVIKFDPKMPDFNNIDSPTNPDYYYRLSDDKILFIKNKWLDDVKQLELHVVDIQDDSFFFSPTSLQYTLSGADRFHLRLSPDRTKLIVGLMIEDAKSEFCPYANSRTLVQDSYRFFTLENQVCKELVIDPKTSSQINKLKFKTWHSNNEDFVLEDPSKREFQIVSFKDATVTVQESYPIVNDSKDKLFQVLSTGSSIRITADGKFEEQVLTQHRPFEVKDALTILKILIPELNEIIQNYCVSGFFPNFGLFTVHKSQNISLATTSALSPNKRKAELDQKALTVVAPPSQHGNENSSAVATPDLDQETPDATNIDMQALERLLAQEFSKKFKPS